MPLIVKQHVFHRYSVVADGLDDFVRFDLEHARVIGALEDDHRLDDVLGVERWRDSSQALGVSSRAMYFGEQGLALRTPPSRTVLRGAQPLGRAKSCLFQGLLWTCIEMKLDKIYFVFCISFLILRT